MRHHVIVRIGTRILVPFILLFALYVQFHGDFGPGGGFQAGVIFGAGCILYGLVFGVEALMGVAPMAVVRAIAAAGVLLYALVGVAGPARRRQLPGLRRARRDAGGPASISALC